MNNEWLKNENMSDWLKEQTKISKKNEQTHKPTLKIYKPSNFQCCKNPTITLSNDGNKPNKQKINILLHHLVLILAMELHLGSNLRPHHFQFLWLCW